MMTVQILQWLLQVYSRTLWICSKEFTGTFKQALSSLAIRLLTMCRSAFPQPEAVTQIEKSLADSNQIVYSSLAASKHNRHPLITSEFKTKFNGYTYSYIRGLVTQQIWKLAVHLLRVDEKKTAKSLSVNIDALKEEETELFKLALVGGGHDGSSMFTINEKTGPPQDRLLHRFARKRDLAGIKKEIEINRVHCCSVDLGGNTALHIVCERGLMDCVEYLLGCVDGVLAVKIRNFQGYTPLDIARNNNRKTIILLLERAEAQLRLAHKKMQEKGIFLMKRVKIMQEKRQREEMEEIAAAADLTASIDPDVVRELALKLGSQFNESELMSDYAKLQETGNRQDVRKSKFLNEYFTQLFKHNEVMPSSPRNRSYSNTKTLNPNSNNPNSNNNNNSNAGGRESTSNRSRQVSASTANGFNNDLDAYLDDAEIRQLQNDLRN